MIFANGQIFPAADFFNDGAPLTGQSEHLANLQIGLENTDRISQQTFLLTYASERVTNRGPSGTPQQPDIIEKPGLRLDFVAREEVSAPVSRSVLRSSSRTIATPPRTAGRERRTTVGGSALARLLG